MAKQRFYLELESDASVLADFYSGVKSMDEFIHNRLSVFLRVYKDSRFYVLRNEDGLVLAMCVLSSGQLFLDEDCKDDLRIKFPDIDEREDLKEYWQGGLFPSIEINYLAVNQDYQGKHIGSKIIDTISKFKDDDFYNHPLFISVDALCTKEYSAVGFYDRCRFLASEYMNMKLDTLRMYRTIR